MHRLRFLLLLGLVLAVGTASAARAQETMSGLDQEKKAERESKPDKAKNKAKPKNDDGKRKHWWSLPHFRHKKHDANADAARKGTKTSSKTVAAKPANKTSAPTKPANKTAGVSKPVQKPQAKAGQSNKTASAASSGKKTTASASQSKKTTASKTVAGQHKKPAQHNCTPEEAKKGGCQMEKGNSARRTASAS